MTEKKMTTDQMKGMLRAERQQRVTACTNELQELLTKHNCRIEFEIRLKSNGQVEPIMMVLANQEPE